MSSTPFLTPGRVCLSLVAASTSISCFLADWNETHVKNPKWPPHARFHNGQTMSMGLLLGLTTAYFTWRPTTNYKDSIFCAAMVGSLYWISGMSAILYPGTKWVDPEFDATGKAQPQPPVFAAHFVLCWVGYWLETRRLAGQKLL